MVVRVLISPRRTERFVRSVNLDFPKCFFFSKKIWKFLKILLSENQILLKKKAKKQFKQNKQQQKGIGKDGMESVSDTNEPPLLWGQLLKEPAARRRIALWQTAKLSLQTQRKLCPLVQKVLQVGPAIAFCSVLCPLLFLATSVTISVLFFIRRVMPLRSSRSKYLPQWSCG